MTGRLPKTPPLEAVGADEEMRAPQDDAPVPDSADTHSYWQAANFSQTLLAEFEAARQEGRAADARERFYVLARYYRRTLAILHSAFDRRDEPLATTALRNLIILQRALAAMHRVAPHTAPSTLALESDVHRRINRDVVHELLRESSRPVEPGAIVRSFNEMDLIADIRVPAVVDALGALVATGHAVERDGRYAPTDLPYLESNLDHASLAMLLGPGLTAKFADAGFEGISTALERRTEFCERFEMEAGLGPEAATLTVACLKALAAPVEAFHGDGPWEHADLSGSAHPRPYQRVIHAVFRGQGYAAQVIEAPAGSGKTLIGMLCIEDWLHAMAPGQSVLVLVPTVDHQEHWVGELCLNPIGLRVSPDIVYAGNPSGLEALRHRTGVSPAVIVATYSDLATGTAGVGDFDRAAVERFLEGNNVQHVVLDEVDRVVADLGGTSARIAGVLLDWVRDGRLSSLIGFSRTLTAFRPQLLVLGLTLAYVLPPAELIPQG